MQCEAVRGADVYHIEPGLPIFLFNYNDRYLHGAGLDCCLATIGCAPLPSRHHLHFAQPSSKQVASVDAHSVQLGQGAHLTDSDCRPAGIFRATSYGQLEVNPHGEQSGRFIEITLPDQRSLFKNFPNTRLPASSRIKQRHTSALLLYVFVVRCR